MVSVLSIEDGIKIVKMLNKSVNDTFCMHEQSSGCGQRYPNFLLIRTVPNFSLAKGVRIIEVGLYYNRVPLHHKLMDHNNHKCINTLLTTMLPSSGLTFSLDMISPLCSVVPSEVSTQLCWSLPRGTLSTWTIGVARPTPHTPAPRKNKRN